MTENTREPEPFTALAYSGGLDSACAWWALGKPPAIYCGGNFGPARHANHSEMDAIEDQMALCPEFCDALKFIDFDFRPFMRPGEWYFARDKVIAKLAWAAGVDRLLIGWHSGDCSVEWGQRQCREIANSTSSDDFQVAMPFLAISKIELMQRALDCGMPRDFAEAASSCVITHPACGKCRPCRERSETLDAALEVINV